MKRKVVKQGHNAMTITLPVEWIKEQGISAGDEIDVELKGKDIVVRKISSSNIDKLTFQMHGKGAYLHRHLAVLYRLGYDEIKIEFDDPALVDKIQYEIEGMPGFKIFDTGENYCVIKNIATGLEKEFDNILRKIFLNLLYCAEQGLNLIKQENFKKLESLKQMARVNNRMTNFCERMLNKEGYKEQKKTILVYNMVWGLEQIEDYYRNIFNYLIEKEKVKIDNNVLKIYDNVNKLFEAYYNLFYSFDAEKLSYLKENCLNNIDKMREMIEKKAGANSVILLNLSLIAERLYHMTESLI